MSEYSTAGDQDYQNRSMLEMTEHNKNNELNVYLRKLYIHFTISTHLCLEHIISWGGTGKKLTELYL